MRNISVAAAKGCIALASTREMFGGRLQYESTRKFECGIPFRMQYLGERAATQGEDMLAVDKSLAVGTMDSLPRTGSDLFLNGFHWIHTAD